MIVVWRITSKCNLACKFCGFDREFKRIESEADPNMIKTFGATLVAYQQLTGDTVLVSWIGGEPFLWLPLFECSAYFHQHYHFQISVTTNGTFLSSPKARSHLLRHFSEVTISVDGLDAFHDHIRRWPRGFQKLKSALLTFRNEKQQSDSKLRLGANVVLMRQNIEHLEELYLELAEWGIEQITFNQLGGRDRPEFYPDHRLLPEQAEWLKYELPKIQSRLAIQGVNLRGNLDYLGRISATAQGLSMPVADCHAGENFIFIDERGQISPCSFSTAAYGVSVNEIRSLADFILLPKRFEKARTLHRIPECDDCPSTQVFGKFEVTK